MKLSWVMLMSSKATHACSLEKLPMKNKAHRCDEIMLLHDSKTENEIQMYKVCKNILQNYWKAVTLTPSTITDDQQSMKLEKGIRQKSATSCLLIKKQTRG